MGLLFGHGGLAAVAFLLALNGLRPGAKRGYLDALLLGIWLLLLAWIGAEFGGEAAGVAAGMSLLYGAVALPLAAPTARALFGPEPPEGWRGPHPPSPALRRISEGLARGEMGAEGALLALCGADPVVGEAMRRRSAAADTLTVLYARLRSAGAGRWAGEHYVAASALADPDALAWLLDGETVGEKEVGALVAYFGWATPLPGREGPAS